MVDDGELIVFILATGMLIIILSNLRRISAIPHYKWLIAGYTSVYAGWSFTILEGFAFGTAFNIVEHVCYALSMVLVVGWSICMLLQKGMK